MRGTRTPVADGAAPVVIHRADAASGCCAGRHGLSAALFTVLDSLSLPGSPERANEDAFGATARWAWVIDAAIFPGTPAALHETSDAAWFAAFASARFAALAEAASDGAVLVRQVIGEARAAFLAVAPEDRHDPFTWPIAALTLVRASETGLDVWSLADTVAYVRDWTGTVSKVGEGATRREAESRNAETLLRETGAKPGAVAKTAAFRDWLAGLRRQANTSAATAVFGLDDKAAQYLDHRFVPCEPRTALLLASDGFSALVELYRHRTARTLMAAALSDGLEPLARELRHIEETVDPDGARFPRFKQSDDATALLLCFR